MKQILIEVAKILWTVPDMKEDLLIAILNPLKTETKAAKMLKYLQENKNDAEIMRIDRLLKKTLQIAEENQKMVLFLLIIKKINKQKINSNTLKIVMLEMKMVI